MTDGTSRRRRMRLGGAHRRGPAVEDNRRIPPVVWLLVALGGLVTAALLGMHGFRAVQNQSLVTDRVICEAPSDGACLERVHGQLSGPRYTRREPGDEWSLDVDGKKYDAFDMPGSAEDELLRLSGHASVLARDGDVVAVELDGSRVQPTWGLGWRGAAASFIWLVMALGLSIGALDFGIGRRRAVGSWWRVEGRYPVSPASPVATLLVLPGCLGFLSMAVGIPWWQAWLGVMGVAFAATWSFLPPSSPKWLAFRSGRGTVD